MQTVAVIVQDGAEPFGLGSLVEVWGESYHPEDQNPVFDFRVCTPRPGRARPIRRPERPSPKKPNELGRLRHAGALR